MKCLHKTRQLLNHAIHPIPDRKITWPVADKMRVAAMQGPRDTIIAVNGIFGSKNVWETQAANWGNANTTMVWIGFYYWTGLFLSGQDQHADELANVIATAS